MRQTLLSALLIAPLLLAPAHAADAPPTVSYTVQPDAVGIAINASSGGSVQVLIDADGSPKTGFVLDAERAGFDLLLEGQTLYAHEGKADEWTWKKLSDSPMSTEGSTNRWRVARSGLSSDKPRFFARILTADWQRMTGADPNGVVSVPLTSAPTPKAGASLTIADPDTDCADAASNLVSLEARTSGASLVLTLKTHADSKFESLLLFADTDANPKTGFAPATAPGQGFDLLVQGDNVFKHAGTDRSAWTWDKIGAAKRTVSGATLQIEIDATLLKSARIGLSAWFMSADFQTPLDRVPDDGTSALTIDAKPAPASKPVEPAKPRANRDLPPRQRMASANSYYCYYGAGKVAELSHYDVAILHSPEMPVADVRALNELGVVTVGYLTVGEDDKLRVANGTGPGGKASWYFDKDNDNQPDKNGIWNSYYANAADPAWRADRVAEARRLIDHDGYQGIFLDTIDTATVYPQSKDGMVQLVRELREALPDKCIVLNQGWDVLAAVAPFADGLMLESFTLTYDFETKSYVRNYPQSMDYHLRRVNGLIKPTIARNPLKVFVLEYARPEQTAELQEAANRSATLGFLFAAAPIFLDEVYRDLPVGKPDPKWLAYQATPESMSITLAESRNGFPAGTKVLPSSCFGGYTVAPVLDSIADRSKLHWSKAAWASAEDEEPATLEFRFPQPLTGGTLTLFWHDEAGPSRNFTIEVQQGGKWVVAQTVQGNVDRQSHHALPAGAFDAIRITQPPAGGSAGRPNLMWLAQVSYDKQ